MIPPKKALLLGATGLVGRSCLEFLLQDDRYDHVMVWVRKSTGLNHPKLHEVIIDFSTLSAHAVIPVDDVFCCLGTTIKKAGSQEAFRKVDHEYVVQLAGLARRSNAKTFQVVSSIGANAKSKNFYLRTKGLMEEAVKNSGIPSICILQPSFLLGDRREFRFGEKIAKVMMPLFTPLMIGSMKKYRGIAASDVAKVMLMMAHENNEGIQVIESNRIKDLAK